MELDGKCVGKNIFYCTFIAEIFVQNADFKLPIDSLQYTR